jgi:hypothetical protein
MPTAVVEAQPPPLALPPATGRSGTKRPLQVVAPEGDEQTQPLALAFFPILSFGL